MSDHVAVHDQALILSLPANPRLPPTLLGIPEECRAIIFQYLYEDAKIIIGSILTPKRHDVYGKEIEEGNDTSLIYHLSTDDWTELSHLAVCTTFREEIRRILFDNLRLIIDVKYVYDDTLPLPLPRHFLGEVRELQVIGEYWDPNVIDSMDNLQVLRVGGDLSYQFDEESTSLALYVNQRAPETEEEWLRQVLEKAEQDWQDRFQAFQGHPLNELLAHSITVDDIKVVVNFHIYVQHREDEEEREEKELERHLRVSVEVTSNGGWCLLEDAWEVFD